MNSASIRAAAEVHLGNNWWDPEVDDEDEEEAARMNKKSGNMDSLVYTGQHLG